jgi:hypothetical protein
MKCQYHGEIPTEPSAKFDYKVEGSTYSMNYQDLKSHFEMYKGFNDGQFIDQAIKIFHFASFVCYFKNIPTQAILCDKGILHQLAHLIDEDTKEDAVREISEIRERFNIVCALA